MSAVFREDFWDSPLNAPAIVNVISAWTAAYVRRQARYLDTKGKSQADFFAALYAREYPQRFMEFALSDQGTMTNWKMTKGICGCVSSSSVDIHAELDANVNNVFYGIGRPWQRLACAMHALGIKEVPEACEFSALHTLALLEESFKQNPSIALQMHWEEDGKPGNKMDVDWSRATIAKSRGLLYARLMLDFRLPETMGGNAFVFPYHEFDQVFEQGLARQDIGLYLVTLCEVARKRVADAREKVSTAAERIYRAYPGSPQRGFVTGMLAQFPELAGVNLQSSSDILKALRSSSPPNSFADINEYEKQAIKVVRVFGRNWERWLSRFQSDDRAFYDQLHDASMPLKDLPLKQQKSLGKYLLKYILTDITCLTMVSRNWAVVTEADMLLDPGSLASSCIHNTFEHEDEPDHQRFAFECAIWNLSDKDWPMLYERWKAAQRVPMPAWGGICVNIDEYVGRFLPRNDSRIVWMGEYTNCCQSHSGIASDCAYHSMESPYGACFVVENKNREIVAASWVWEGSKGVCFDSLEAKGVGNRAKIVQDVYIAARDAILGLNLHRVSRVTMGAAHKKVFEAKDVRRTIKLNHRRNNYKGKYTDAKTQYEFPDRNCDKEEVVL